MPMGPVGPDNESLISQTVSEQQKPQEAEETKEDDTPAEGTHELE